VNPVRRLFLGAIALLALQASAETVMLRRTGNPAVITFEYITQDELTILVKRVDADAVLTYKWEDLDQDWIRQNNPRLWAERKQLLEMADSKKAAKPATDDDPFSKEAEATDARSLLRNLNASLQVGLSGLPLNTNRAEAVCSEFALDENLFWLAFQELKNASRPRGTAVGKEAAEPMAEEMKESKEAKETNPKAKAKGKNGAKPKVRPAESRSPESLAAEAAARRDLEQDTKPYTALGYLRLLADGGPKAKPIWVMLRRSAADRDNIQAALVKHAALAGELAEKSELKPAKTELLGLKKALESCQDSIGKVNRDSTSMEPRLANDCRGLLTLLQR
jgi:hypothetical protein